MFKTVALIILIAVGCALAETRRPSAGSIHIKRVKPVVNNDISKLDWCPQCIDTFDDLIELVLDAILQYGILNSCGDLCNIVIDKSGSTLLGFLCMVGCDVLGIEEFAKIMQKADIDPIYYCENIKLCPSEFQSIGNESLQLLSLSF